MDLICPECRAVLTANGRTARCIAHGGEYEVMFDRATESMRRTSGAQTVAAPSTPCTNHPRTTAAYVCPRCSRPICTMCAFEVNGRQYCPDCATHAASGESEPQLTAPPPPPPAPMPQPQWQQPAAPYSVNDAGILSLNLTQAPAPLALASVPAGMKCVQHAEVDASTRCRVCSSGMCAVCDFALPNGMHVCPACIETRSTDDVDPTRNYKAWGGIAVALLSTVLFAIDIAVAAGGDLASSKILDIVVLIVIVLGVWLSYLPFEPAIGNTASIWTAVVWNSINLGVFVLLSIVGNFAGA